MKDNITGKRIKQGRKALKLSQAAFAERCGVNPVTASSWECGRYQPNRATLETIASVLNVSIDYLLGRSESPSENNPLPSQLAESFVPILERDWIADHEKEFFDGVLYSGVSVSVPLSMEKLFSASTAAQKPYAVFVENDGLERSNYYENDLVILDANKPALQGVVALIKHYGVLALRLIYNLPDGSILLQNDDGEVVVSVDEKTTDGVYKCFGAAIGCIRAKPKAQPLVRKK